MAAHESRRSRASRRNRPRFRRHRRWRLGSAPKGLSSDNAALGRSVAERRRSSEKLLFVFSGTTGSVSLEPFANGGRCSHLRVPYCSCRWATSCAARFLHAVAAMPWSWVRQPGSEFPLPTNSPSIQRRHPAASFLFQKSIGAFPNTRLIIKLGHLSGGLASCQRIDPPRRSPPLRREAPA